MPADPWGNTGTTSRDHLPTRSWFHWSLLDSGHLAAVAAVVVTLGLGVVIWMAAGQSPRPCPGCEVPDQVGVGLTEAGDSIQVRLVTCDVETVERIALYDQDGGTRWEIRATEPHSERVFLTNQVFGAFEEVVPLDNLPVSTDLSGVVEADRTYVFEFNVLDLHRNEIFYRYRLWDTASFEDAALEAACPPLELEDTQARLLALALLAVLGAAAYVASGRIVSGH